MNFFPQSWFTLVFFLLQFKCYLSIGLRNLYAVTLSEKMAKFDVGKEKETTFTLRLHNVYIQNME